MNSEHTLCDLDGRASEYNNVRIWECRILKFAIMRTWNQTYRTRPCGGRWHQLPRAPDTALGVRAAQLAVPPPTPHTPVADHSDKDLYYLSGSCTKFTYSCSARQLLMSFSGRFSVWRPMYKSDSGVPLSEAEIEYATRVNPHISTRRLVKTTSHQLNMG